MRSVIIISPNEKEIDKLYQQWKEIGNNIYFDSKTFNMKIEGERIYISCFENGKNYYEDNELSEVKIDIPYFYVVDYSDRRVMNRFLLDSIFSKGSFLDNDLGRIVPLDSLQKEGFLNFIQ